jgi:hypothetical protein
MRKTTMNRAIIDLITDQLQVLLDDHQQYVLKLARALALSQSQSLTGVPGNRLLNFVDFIPLEDLKKMQIAITADCEQIDFNEW